MGLLAWVIRTLSTPATDGDAEPDRAADVPEPESAAERLLLEEIAAGAEIVELERVPEKERVMRADFLAAVVLGAQDAAQHGIRIDGGEVVISGVFDLSYVRLDRPLSMFRCHFVDRVRLGRCRVPALDLVGCELDNGLWGASLEVAASLDLEASTITGEASLIGASIGADLIGRGLVIRHAGNEEHTCVGEASDDEKRVALHLGNATIGATLAMGRALFGGTRPPRPFSADGEVRLRQSKIGDSLILSFAELSAEGHALTADGAEIGASVALDGARINGELSFIGVTIGADADFGGAILANGDKDVLTLDGCTVTGNLLFTNGFAATGTVRLIGSDLSSSLQCDEASFRRPNGVALALDQATIGTLELRATTFAGSLRLYRTSVDILDDDLGTGDQKLGSWASASPLVVTGVTVQRFASGDDVTLRKNWLLKNDHFDPGTWQSLIDLYRIHGREGDARAAAIARESDRLDRGGLRWWQKPGPWIFGAVIGYGYRPLQAGAWALGIVAVFALLVAQGDAHIVALKDAPHPKPNSVIYALDVFLPVIDFGEAKNWRVEDWLEWAQWGVIALGWTLTTLFVAGFTRLVRS